MVSGRGLKTKLYPLGNAVRTVPVANFVAVAESSSTGIYSADGITWTSMTLPSYQTWSSVAYGNGKFVALAENSSTGAYSIDGINWISMTLPSSQEWSSIVYGNSKFLAIGKSTTGAYSTDGINWTSVTFPVDADSVACGNGIFIIARNDGTRTTGCVAYSTNVTTWSMAVSKIADVDLVAYGNGKFLAFSGTTPHYSTDGNTWYASASLSFERTWYSLSYGNGKYIVVGGYPNEMSVGLYSTDGITSWGYTYLQISQYWFSVTYGNGKFVAVGGGPNSGVVYSADGTNWTQVTLPEEDMFWRAVCAKTD